MAASPGFHVRIPPDVRSAAEARAEREHRTLSDVIVRHLRAYGSEESGPRDAGGWTLNAYRADIGEPPLAAPEASEEPREAAECKHPGVRPKNRCPACGRYNLG